MLCGVSAPPPHYSSGLLFHPCSYNLTLFLKSRIIIIIVIVDYLRTTIFLESLLEPVRRVFLPLPSVLFSSPEYISPALPFSTGLCSPVSLVMPFPSLRQPLAGEQSLRLLLPPWQMSLDVYNF